MEDNKIKTDLSIIENRNKTVEKYMGFAISIAISMLRVYPHFCDSEDIKQAAYIGLIRATKKYNPNYGFSFMAFARPHIRGEILDQLRREDHISRLQRDKQRKGLYSPPSIGSSNNPIFDNGGKRIVYSDILEDKTITGIKKAEEIEEWNHIISILTKRQKIVMTLYFCHEINMKEIGHFMGFSESNVSIIIKAAKEKIKEKIERQNNGK